jgi:hypothetical protein
MGVDAQLVFSYRPHRRESMFISYKGSSLSSYSISKPTTSASVYNFHFLFFLIFLLPLLNPADRNRLQRHGRTRDHRESYQEREKNISNNNKKKWGNKWKSCDATRTSWEKEKIKKIKKTKIHKKRTDEILVTKVVLQYRHSNRRWKSNVNWLSRI